MSSATRAPSGAAASAARRGVGDLAEIVRALDGEGLRSPTCGCTRRRSTTSFSRRPAARSRAPEADRGRRRSPRRRPPMQRASARRPGRARLRAARCSKTLRQPFQLFPIIFFPVFLLAVNAERVARGDAPARLPDRLLHHLRDRRRLYPGRDVLADQHRHEPRRGHRDRLLQPPRAHADARASP